MLTEARIERGSGAGRSATRTRGGAGRSFEDGAAAGLWSRRASLEAILGSG
jgi:hypothetical protein